MAVKKDDICVFTTQSTSADTGKTENLRYDVVVATDPYKDFYGTDQCDVMMWDGKKGTGRAFSVAMKHLRAKK